LTLAALMSCLLSHAAWAGDNSYLYGTDKPNPSQLLNRHFTLLEHALIDLVMIRTQNDSQFEEEMTKRVPGYQPREKSGYFPDRKGASEAAWAGYQRAGEAVNKNPKDLSPAASFAEGLRSGSFKEIASFYLEQTKAPEPEKLSDFESDLLVSYLKWAPEEAYVKFTREWLEVVVPRSPEEHYLLRERVSHCRAFLRSELRRYLDDPPKGIQEPQTQFAELASRASGLIDKDPKALEAFYARAGMRLPQMAEQNPTARNDPPAGESRPEEEKEPQRQAKADPAQEPRPETGPTEKSEVKPWPEEKPRGKPFVYRFTDLEHAVLTYLISLEREKEEFRGDQQAADSDPAQAEALLAKWRKRVMDQVTAYLDPEERKKSEASPGRLDPFEQTYAEWRLKRLDPGMPEELKRLAKEAEEASAKGDPEAGARMVRRLRRLIQEDLAAYKESEGRSQDKALTAWAQEALKPDNSLAQLFPPQEGEVARQGKDDSGATETPPPPPAPLAQVIEKLFSDRVEQVLAAYLLDSSHDRAKDEAELKSALSDERLRPEVIGKWQKRVAATIREDLVLPNPQLMAFLEREKLGVTDLLAYYCPRYVSPTAVASKPSALEQAKQLEGKGQEALDAAGLEQAASSGWEATSEVVNLCLGYFAEKKREAALALNKKEKKPEGLKIQEVPLKTQEEKRKDQAVEERRREPASPRALGRFGVGDRIAGGALGLGLLGILGILLGFSGGPLVGLALLGALSGAAIAHFASKSEGA